MKYLSPPGSSRAFWLALATIVLGAASLWAAPASRAASTFDHFTTGFDLIGQHRSVPCESCHVGGIFKGTPTDCFSCHAAGSRIGASAKPTNHILSSNDCAACHTPYGWRPVAKFNHLNVLGSCSSCHNNVQTVGKSTKHIPTTAECSTCHLVTLPWKAAHYDHAGITNNCERCHDNVHAPGKPPTHLPTTNLCETCHMWQQPLSANFVTFAGTPMNHVGITNDCQSCHETGMSWAGAKMVDRPTPAQDAFHPLATDPNGADCSSCHTGFNVGDFNKGNKPANHIPTKTGSPCKACHDLGNLAVMGTLGQIHANAPSSTTNCQQCHGANSSTFDLPAINFHIVGLPGNHLPTSVSCEVCHAGPGSSFASVPVQDGAKFTNSLMNHAGSTTCDGCHGPSVLPAQFVGISNIIVMPPTTPMGASSHIPSNNSCENCHSRAMPSGYIAASATASVPGSRFGAAFLPNTTEIHAGMKTGCTACHEKDNNWMGMDKYPIAPTVFIVTTQYTGFQTRPYGTLTPFSIVDAAHPAGGDCVQCHGTNFNFFDSQVKPDNHIPTASTAACANCHNVGDFAQFPTVGNIHLYAPSQTGNCVQCHSESESLRLEIPAVNFKITSMSKIVTAQGGTTPVKHMPTTQSCEVCHVGSGSSVPGTVVDGSKFAGSKMNHAGLTTCVGCHGPTITGSSFTGISTIVIMPATTPSTDGTAHIPSSTACEACHQQTMPTGQIAANAAKQAPGSLFLTPAPTTKQVHSGVTTGCQSCHEYNMLWMGIGQYPINPTTFSSGAQYTGFQMRPNGTQATYRVKDAAHPSSGDCQTCHGTNFDYFESQVKPSNHIPYASTATCANCHTGSDFSVHPTLTNIHKYAPSSTTNCVLCHGTTQAPVFSIPAANFTITTMALTATGKTVTHIPTTAACETCHVGTGSSVPSTVDDTSTFAGSRMNHAGLTTCVGCHGPTITGSSFTGISTIVIMPATTPSTDGTAHIPSSTACEACHQQTMPTGQIAANAAKQAPGSLFLTPAPTTTQVHSGVTTGCQNCHEYNMLWMGIGQYPINPTTFSSGAQYTGFQMRPNGTQATYRVKDAAHPSSGDCQTCHGTNFNYFESQVKPSNHIPYASTATCANCHTGSDFSVHPTLTNIHKYAPSSTTNCVLCHGTTQAPVFSIPAANFTITTMALTATGKSVVHLPTTAACETCHVGAGSSVPTTVGDTSTFAGSRMNHAGLTTCVGCHGPTVAAAGFTGIAKVIIMPATSPATTGTAHIPSGTACQTCHQGSMPTGLIAASSTASVPGSLFATPVPSTSQIHSGVTTGCQACHESNYVWLGMANYKIVPATLSTNTATQYTGFQTRPSGAAGTYMILDAKHPSSGDCYTCHSTNFTYFSGAAEPANHIPTVPNATCSTCHTTAGDYSQYTSNMTTLHTLVSGTCTSCHNTTKTFAGPTTSWKPEQFGDKGLHFPITNAGIAVECSACHVVTAFSGTTMLHAKIGDSLNSASGQACMTCHETGYGNHWLTGVGFKLNFIRPNGHHTGQDCLNGGGCHTGGKDINNKANFKAQPRPGKRGPTVAPKPGTATPAPSRSSALGALRPTRRGSVLDALAPVDHTALGGRPCASCHNGALATGMGPAHPKTTTACADCHSVIAWAPVLRVDHADVLGACVTCHNGKAATGKPAGHLMSGTDCDRCHTTSAWKPAAYDHGGVIAGTCASCHNGVQAVTKSPRHVLTFSSCDTCHYVLGWSPVKPPMSATHRATPPPRLPFPPRGRPNTAPLPRISQ